MEDWIFRLLHDHHGNMLQKEWTCFIDVEGMALL